MAEETLTKVEKNTQKILEKLISEERIAVDFYMGALNNVKPEQRALIHDKFKEIALDEKHDHFKKLVKFATLNGYEVPFKYKDFEKFASKKTVNLFNSLKVGEDALYYIEKAIESEKDAIASYEKALSEEFVFELQAVLLNNYYDELEHLEELELLYQCTAMGVVIK